MIWIISIKMFGLNSKPTCHAHKDEMLRWILFIISASNPNHGRPMMLQALSDDGDGKREVGYQFARFLSSFKPVFWIRISLNADPDPGFYLNADPDADPDSRFWIHKQYFKTLKKKI